MFFYVNTVRVFVSPCYDSCSIPTQCDDPIPLLNRKFVINPPEAISSYSLKTSGFFKNPESSQPRVWKSDFLYDTFPQDLDFHLNFQVSQKTPCFYCLRPWAHILLKTNKDRKIEDGCGRLRQNCITIFSISFIQFSIYIFFITCTIMLKNLHRQLYFFLD